MWFCVFGWLVYRRGEKMVILGGLNLISIDYYLNKILLLFVKRKCWKFVFVYVI